MKEFTLVGHPAAAVDVHTCPTCGTILMPITGTELLVVIEAAKGCGNKEIARRMNIALPTVKNHMNSIMRKMGCSDRTAVVVRAFVEGWITFETSPNGTG